MKPIALALDLDCSREEAALFADLVAFLDRRKADPHACPGAALDRALGGAAARILGAIADDIDDFGISCSYQPAQRRLTITDQDGAPNLGALPLLLVQLFPAKLPIAYRTTRPGSSHPPIWTVISLDRVLVTDDPARLQRELAGGSLPRPVSPGQRVH